MDTMQLMARFFALLGECSPRDLVRASDSVGPTTSLGRALRLLADYRREFSAAGPNLVAGSEAPGARAAVRVYEKAAPVKIAEARLVSRVAPRQTSLVARRISGIAHKPASLMPAVESRLRELIVSSRHFPRTADLVAHLQKSGIQVRHVAKDGRTRIYARVRQTLSAMPVERQTEVLRRLLSTLPSNETDRWFDVIRRGG